MGLAARAGAVVIRYADNVAGLRHSQEQARQVKAPLARWLAPRGLSLNEDKPGKAAIRRLRERLAAETRALRHALPGAALGT
jgi:RNA-directed DNA polymerase